MKKKSISLLLCGAALILTSLVSCSETAEQKGYITNIDDFNGKTVVTLTGSVQDLLLTEKCPDSQILRTDTEADVLTMISNGRAVGGLFSSLSWTLVQDAYSNIVAVGEGLKPQPVGVAFNKENGELRDKFNIFLSHLSNSGELALILDKWLDIEGNPTMPEIDPEKVVNGTIRCAVSAILPPFEFIRNGKVVGSEPEVITLFAKSLGMDVEFVDINFSGLIAYLQSGKAEMGCSAMCITPERQQSVDFSDPWTVESSKLLVNKKYLPEGYVVGQEVKVSFWEKTKNSFVKSLVKEDRYMLLVEGLKSTILISLLAAIFGTLFGMLLCYLSKKRNRLVAGATNVYIEFMRCMPQVVFLMIMFYVVFGDADIDGMWVAIISFSLCFAAYTSVIFRSAVDSIDKGQSEAALSMGFGNVKAFWNVILPQAVQRALPVYKGEFIGLVKATSIVGYIAVFDLTKAGDIIRSRTYEALFPLIIITIVYFIVIWVLTGILKYLETKTQPTRKKFFK